MPVKVTKLKSGKYRVSTPHGVKSKGTTKKKAMAQKRLLNAIDHGWKPSKKKKKRHHSAEDGRFLESRMNKFVQ